MERLSAKPIGRLAHRVAIRVVDQYLHRPDPPHLLHGLQEALQRPLRPLFLPVVETQVYQERWGAAAAAEDSLESLLDYYEPQGEWHREAWRFWDRLLTEARHGLSTAMGHAWRSGFEVVHEQARAALAQAHMLLETELERAEGAVAEYQERFEAALVAAGQGEMTLAEVDRLVAAYLLEAMRLGALERLALSIDGVVELVMDALWAKASAVRRLLQAVEAYPVPAETAGEMTNAEEEEWLGEIQPRLTRALLYDASAPEVDALLEAAQQDVDRYVRTRRPSTVGPIGSRLTK